MARASSMRRSTRPRSSRDATRSHWRSAGRTESPSTTRSAWPPTSWCQPRAVPTASSSIAATCSTSPPASSTTPSSHRTVRRARDDGVNESVESSDRSLEQSRSLDQSMRTVAALDGEEIPHRDQGHDWIVSWHPPPDALPGTPHGATGICVTLDGEVVVISQDGEHWDLPGGRPEGQESLEE